VGEKRAADTLKESGSYLGFFLSDQGAVRPFTSFGRYQTRCVFSQ